MKQRTRKREIKSAKPRKPKLNMDILPPEQPKLPTRSSGLKAAQANVSGIYYKITKEVKSVSNLTDAQKNAVIIAVMGRASEIESGKIELDRAVIEEALKLQPKI